MNKITVINKSNHTSVVQSIRNYIKWINRNNILNQSIKIIIHDAPISSYGYLSDCQVDFDNRHIYYSLYNIEEYLVAKKSYNIIVNRLECALSEILYDLNYHIAQFYTLEYEKVTHKELEDSYGYFQYPKSLFKYPRIVVSTNSYEQLKKEMSLFDSDLNILRTLAHEIGHYQDYISDNIILDEKMSEKIAYKYEDELIQEFIDQVYYVNYHEN
ncbi:hypothetical protein [Mammaliicoccus sciuri]|uniref:hypothetical protein n=1 Tax=Mammaliicoccus sciuri TaxID=1296 RepID=UPI000B1BF109|nr:hypothetical protein [Mammaliicoccus sciuri]MDQ7131071.1 hypothetical protein [Mammaliicoccus sciuri]PNY95387.1 hypothetical protein CD035_05450 [Mammaliicoccus sciuri]PTK17280.1 hypothetical protein BUZ90_01775 [Mammaliicoccus sciuri]QDR64948.1 hypothetical protein FPV13_08660 [Mammaliicoccus sciuri]RIN81956.1 hypothetical protein BU007_03770 [Mammaliicoccus sciuri]